MRVGILGAGQLAQMLALAAAPLGIETICLTEHRDVPARLGASLCVAPFQIGHAVDDFLAAVDVVTYENEFIDLDFVRAVAKKKRVYPMPDVLAITQDRLLEKRYCESLGLQVADYVAVDSLHDLQQAFISLDKDAILKTRRMGYDGKGQFKLGTEKDVHAAWEKTQKQALILERRVPFTCEVSQLLARNAHGELAFYPLTENRHHEGILRLSKAPCQHPVWVEQAQAMARTLAESLDYVGVLAVEFFVVDDCLLVNECAPRVHNSGHWTIEGCVCSQFENHMRAICGWPLGCVDCVADVSMYNVISRFPDKKALLAIQGACVHDYRKTPRAGRKLGHVTLVQQAAASDSGQRLFDLLVKEAVES